MDKRQLKAKALAYLIRLVLRVLITTCRFKITGKENFLKARAKGPCLIVLWHNQLALIGLSLLKIAPKEVFTAFVSNSRDGDIVAEYTTSHSTGRVIRVPHDSKDRALKMLTTRLRLNREVPVVTPDGPKGPRYTFKPGAIIAAKETGATLVPFSWQASRFWELSSWDGFRIPKPFSTIEAHFGSAIQLGEESSLESDITEVEKILLEKTLIDPSSVDR